jgi:hypothetical protein
MYKEKKEKETSMGCRQTCQEEREGWWTLNAANK